MGNLIRKPSELEAKTTIAMMLYGQPGAGKTTLGCSAPNAVLFDYDGGVQRINVAHQIPTVQVKSWEDTAGALEEIEKEMPEAKTIVIDTVGKMLDFMSASIIKNDSKLAQRDGSLSLKGYGVRKNMFINFIKQLAISGKNVVFIAHEKEDKRGDEYVKRPEIGGSSANDLMKELDLVGYVQLQGNDRVVCWNPTEWYYAKNTCTLPATTKVPLTVDDKGMAVGDNNFIASIITQYGAVQKNKQQLNGKYDVLVKKIKEQITAVHDIKGANYILETIIRDAKYPHIFNSKLIAQKELNARAKAIGIKFNKVAGQYEAA